MPRRQSKAKKAVSKSVERHLDNRIKKDRVKGLVSRKQHATKTWKKFRGKQREGE